MIQVFSGVFPRLIAIPATVIAGLAGGIAPSSAAVVSFSDTIAMQLTNWDEAFSVSKFNPALGTLTSVQYTLTGTVEGSAAYENFAPTAAAITLNLSAVINVDTPGGSIAVTVTPLASITEAAAVYDGTIDFDGASGSTLGGLTDTDTASNTLFVGLAPFIGLGDIILAAEALASSTGSGSGNLATNFTSEAAATLTINYFYDILPPPPSVPEPMSMSLIGAGLLGLGGLMRRKKAAK